MGRINISIFQVPLYVDSSRSQLVASVVIPVDSPLQWRVASVALFLS